jgi:hypothetical protein
MWNSLSICIIVNNLSPGLAVPLYPQKYGFRVKYKNRIQGKEILHSVSRFIISHVHEDRAVTFLGIPVGIVRHSIVFCDPLINIGLHNTSKSIFS